VKSFLVNLIEAVVICHFEVESFSRLSELANLRFVVDEVAELEEIRFPRWVCWQAVG
jgi:hypothetical protein